MAISAWNRQDHTSGTGVLCAVVSLAMIAGADGLTWTGAYSSDWLGAGNWLDAHGAAATFSAGDVVTFCGDATSYAVDVSAPVTVGGIVVDGTAAYTLAGGTKESPSIGGTGGLVKRGSGRLVVSGFHDFTGDVTIEAGDLQLCVQNPA